MLFQGPREGFTTRISAQYNKMENSRNASSLNPRGAYKFVGSPRSIMEIKSIHEIQ